MVQIFIARHGNTFDKGDTILRVGKRTDLPLSNSGREQSKKLAEYISENNYSFDVIYTSNLIRTKQTAEIICNTANLILPASAMDFLDEVDYGQDDGKDEKEVISKIGKESLEKWEKESILPDGWMLDIDKVKQNWINLAERTVENKSSPLIVTSNGIARFAPFILDKEERKNIDSYKMKTCGLSCFSYENGKWQLKFWNV